MGLGNVSIKLFSAFIYSLQHVSFLLISFFPYICRYAYAVASALHGVHHSLRKDFMIQVLTAEKSCH